MKVHIRTFGCRANHYDSEAARALIERGGHLIVDDVADADVALFNSCAVTADAVADLRQAVRRVARENGPTRSVIMGCASGLPEALQLHSLPGVTDVLPGADLEGLAAALGIERDTSDLLTREQSGARALLRVQDGCDEHCTFCATTIARGANRSRPIDALVREAGTLAERHPEIVITGVHIGTYGRDSGRTLGELMSRLVVSVPAARFRLTSIEATEVTDDLIDLMASNPRGLVPQIHAPLQSGSDRVLRRMGRHWYTMPTYRAAIEKIARRLPVFGLGADIITGFPDETDADHRETVRLVEHLPFTYLHVFPYSERPGTAALRIPGRISGAVARERAGELRAIGSRKAEAHRAARSGQLADVVGIGAGRGLTEDYLEIRVGDQVPRRERKELRLGVHSWESTTPREHT
jgi:threonylcarbamoyladenosine tRNA methylthiotransferase MtaB